MEHRLENVAEASLQMVEKAEGFSPELLAAILRLEGECFPASWQYEDADKYYKKMLEDSENINIFLKDRGKIVGYLLARFHNKETSELFEYDHEFKDQENVFYIETIQIVPESQGKGGAKKLLLAVCEEAKKRGVGKLSIHARKIDGFNEAVKKIFAGKVVVVREIKNWQPAQGESYEYMELKC